MKTTCKFLEELQKQQARWAKENGHPIFHNNNNKHNRQDDK